MYRKIPSPCYSFPLLIHPLVLLSWIYFEIVPQNCTTIKVLFIYKGSANKNLCSSYTTNKNKPHHHQSYKKNNFPLFINEKASFILHKNNNKSSGIYLNKDTIIVLRLRRGVLSWKVIIAHHNHLTPLIITRHHI